MLPEGEVLREMTEYVPVINSIEFRDTKINVLRLDLIHPLYGGNKFFKLKYNLLKAEQLRHNTILTFGGAHSNHIFSAAAICKEKGFRSIGVIRGEQAMVGRSPTLQFAMEQGMQLHFVSREQYSGKTNISFINSLKETFGNFWLIPEGGNNEEGVKGCMEILRDDLQTYPYVFCACGTGNTFSGIRVSAAPEQLVTGISVLKGENTLIDEVNNRLKKYGISEIEPYQEGIISGSCILNDYHFGGYAAFSKELVLFKREFENMYNIPLDHIYTSKLFYAVFDLIKNKKIKSGSRLLVIHSGGTQGNQGFETRYKISEKE